MSNVVTRQASTFVTNRNIMECKHKPRYMKDSLAYRGSTLWNTVNFNEHGISYLMQMELEHQLKTKDYFNDFKFNVVSASTVRHRDDNFIYF